MTAIRRRLFISFCFGRFQIDFFDFVMSSRSKKKMQTPLNKSWVTLTSGNRLHLFFNGFHVFFCSLIFASIIHWSNWIYRLCFVGPTIGFWGCGNICGQSFCWNPEKKYHFSLKIHSCWPSKRTTFSEDLRSCWMIEIVVCFIVVLCEGISGKFQPNRDHSFMFDGRFGREEKDRLF